MCLKRLLLAVAARSRDSRNSPLPSPSHFLFRPPTDAMDGLDNCRRREDPLELRLMIDEAGLR